MGYTVPVPIFEDSVGAPRALGVLDGDDAVARAQARDLGADGRDDANAFVARRAWQLGAERVGALNGVDVRGVDGGLEGGV